MDSGNRIILIINEGCLHMQVFIKEIIETDTLNAISTWVTRLFLTLNNEDNHFASQIHRFSMYDSVISAISD